MAKTLSTKQQIVTILQRGYAPEHIIQAALRLKYKKFISGSGLTARIRELDGVERAVVKGLHCYRIPKIRMAA